MIRLTEQQILAVHSMMIEMTGIYKVDAAEIQNDCETIEAGGFFLN